ncbi:HTH domain-containing protein [Halarcobacter anaerophilus]|jgi:DNA-binding MarR family transcriptional regulator|uniref:HTH domain-containing protein n=1 Tax=Halarcobacter anaerophilus TaxID=877500 RepID=UPI000695E8A4|nr:HTH domain-containing protein [Halarcobacter anaerophilus]
MEEKYFDLKFLLLEKLNLIEELSFIEAKKEKFESNDIVTSTRILTLIQNGTFTSSELAKKLNISRQAIHKSINNLCSKGYLLLHNEETIKKNKHIYITEKGKELLICRNNVMKKVEKTVEEKIGKDDFLKLKELLKKDWD